MIFEGCLSLLLAAEAKTMTSGVPRPAQVALSGKDASLSTLMIVARELWSKGDFAKADELYSRVSIRNRCTALTYRPSRNSSRTQPNYQTSS